MKTCPACNRSWEQTFRVCPIDGSQLLEMSAGSDTSVGKTLGHCRLVEKIADGDLGPIYKAEDPARGVVAVQIISQDRIASSILRDAFGDAVKLAAQLNHPHAVRIYGMEPTPEGASAVLMEYVDGVDLHQYRQKNPAMSASEACSLVRQAAEGVLAAHRLSMVHGALHPARILVGKDGVVKVAGFHRSGVREGVDVFSVTPANLPYLAPELLGVLRDVLTPDYRIDVYSLGVILYEMLSGRLPYEAKSVQELASLLEGPPPLPPSFSNPQVSPLLSRAVLKTISKHPTERQGSVEEFIRELEVAGQPAREPQRLVVEPRYEPQYPPPPADSGLFAPATPSPRKESPDSIWPEPPETKAKSGEASFFGWFQTRAGRSAESRPARPPLDDSSFGGPVSRRREEGEFEERTVVVSGGGRVRSRKRSFSDTFAGFRSRDEDMTGTGVLPRRRFSNRLYIGLAIGAVVVLGAIIAWFLIFGSASTGKLVVESIPPGAQVYLNEEFRGGTPLPLPEVKAGSYRIRLKLEGYETKEDMVEILANANVEKTYVLVKQTSPAAAPPIIEPVPQPPLTPPSAPRPLVPAKPFALVGAFNNALRSRNLFPPSPDNAWDVLQRWQQSEAAAPSTELEQARLNFCREAEALGREKIGQKDYAGVRSLLDQIRSYNPGIPCATGLPAAYENAVSNSKGDLVTSARAAMERQNYVTPETDNALRYVRLVLAIDPQDSEARTLNGDIFTRAWDQAQAKSSQRQHQEAIDIYRQLRREYPNPPVGTAVIDQNIDKQTQKLSLLKTLKVPYSVQVRHDHGRNILLRKRECTGILRVDGFAIEYQSPGGHPFRVAYDGLQGVKADKSKIIIQGIGVPEGKIELEQVEKNPSPSVTDISAKVQELRKLNADYIK